MKYKTVLLSLLLFAYSSVNAQSIYPNFPDIIVCYGYGNLQNNIYYLSAYDEGAPNVIYTNSSAVWNFSEISYQIPTGDYINQVGETTNCESVNVLTFPTNAGTSTPQAVNFATSTGSTSTPVLPLSTDPVLDVIAAAALMLYAATYVRRVFFS